MTKEEIPCGDCKDFETKSVMRRVWLWNLHIGGKCLKVKGRNVLVGDGCTDGEKVEGALVDRYGLPEKEQT